MYVTAEFGVSDAVLQPNWVKFVPVGPAWTPSVWPVPGGVSAPYSVLMVELFSVKMTSKCAEPPAPTYAVRNSITNCCGLPAIVPVKTPLPLVLVRRSSQ